MNHDALATPAEPMISARTAHQLLCIPMQWMNNKTERCRRGLPHYRIGHFVRFRLGELEQWRDHHAAVITPRLEQADAAAHATSPPPTPTDFDGVNWHRREGLAEIFVRRHGDDYRYCLIRRKWFVRARDRWRQDDTLAAFDLVRGICREAAGRSRTSHARVRFASFATAAAVERIARLRAEPLPVDGEERGQ